MFDPEVKNIYHYSIYGMGTMKEPISLFKKTVDWSTLNWGLTIPISYHNVFHDYNKIKTLRGTQNYITLIFKNDKYKATLRNVNRKVKQDTLQIIYSQDDKFINLLRKYFKKTYQYVIAQRAEEMKKGKKKPNIKIPKGKKEYIKFLTTGEPFVYELEFIPLDNNVENPVNITMVKKDIEFIETEKNKFPCLPDIFNDLADISFGRVNKNKYASKAASTLFEDLIYLVFYSLGYDEAKQLGYKMSGSKKGYPDGELKSHNSDYLIIYDAKERSSEYRMNESDRRAMEDYVKKARVKNFKKIYCVIIASKFGDFPRSISGCPLTYLTAKDLQRLISLKIQNPESVNPLSLEDFFSQGILITEGDLSSWSEEYGIKPFNLDGIVKDPGLGDFI